MVLRPVGLFLSSTRRTTQSPQPWPSLSLTVITDGFEHFYFCAAVLGQGKLWLVFSAYCVQESPSRGGCGSALLTEAQSGPTLHFTVPTHPGRLAPSTLSLQHANDAGPLASRRSGRRPAWGDLFSFPTFIYSLRSSAATAISLCFNIY